MSSFDHQWQKLTALARQAGESRDPAAPFGFATRVAALAGAQPSASPRAVFERLALRGLIVAAGLGVVAVAFNLSGVTTSAQTDAYAAADTVGDLLDIS